MKGINVLCCLLLCFIARSFAQTPVAVTNAVEDYIFRGKEIATLEDKTGSYTFQQVSGVLYANRFKVNSRFYPKNLNKDSYYWYRLKINYKEELEQVPSLIEFFDQTTDEIEAFMPDSRGKYSVESSGAKSNFFNRYFEHKNFEFMIIDRSPGVRTYYFRVKSRESVNVIVVYRSLKYFVRYATTEYFTYGIFYGMILIFSLYNFLMFLAVRKSEYLFYILYIISVGLYEMSADGIAFQFFWPASPDWNAYAYGTLLYLVSTFALLFTRDLLRLKSQAAIYYKIINILIVCRTCYYLFCILFFKHLFYFKFLEFIPLMAAFYIGVVRWKGGFKPARFFVIGYALVILGFAFKALTVLGYTTRFPGFVGHYSLSFSFICEMVCLSFALGDQVRLLRSEKEQARMETIKQMQINYELKDNLNQQLEKQVEERTKEVIEKSEQISQQAKTIESQNFVLRSQNYKLEEQSGQIIRMNILLEQDNIDLKSNIEKVTDALTLSTELSFEDFSKKYTDTDKCNKFLSDIKWSKGFICTKCSNTTFNHGRASYSRRCTKCGYEESVIFATIFQNSRIPINKAFYITYLIYSTKGTISSYELSEKVGIRQSTCWAYAIKVKKAMEDRKKLVKKGNQGWSSLILNVKANSRKLK